MNSRCVSLFVVVSLVAATSAAPLFDLQDWSFLKFNLNEANSCVNFGCEAEATSCTKGTTTSEDGTTIYSVITCLRGGVQLGKYRFIEANPDPNVYQQGYQTINNYSYNHNESVTPSPNEIPTKPFKKDNEIEDLS